MTTHNALPNSFVPKHNPQVVSKILSRLPADSIYKLCLLWINIEITKPKLPKNESQQEPEFLDNDEFIESFKATIKNYRTKRYPKKKIIDKLLVDYYAHGLNLLQYSQIDSQLIIDKPDSFVWQSSTVQDAATSNSMTLNINQPQFFLQNLMKNLSKFFLNHIYISKHPFLPLIIIRIQIFDFQNLYNEGITKISNSIISKKAFFLIIPNNSTNIIHSVIEDQDREFNIILQSIRSSLSEYSNKQINLNNDENRIKNLNSIYILVGNSRFSNSLGSWAPYADGTVDISPFDDPLKHQTFKQLNTSSVNTATSLNSEEERLKKIAKLRFKGSLHSLKSTQFFEDNKPFKRRKLLSDGDDKEEEEEYQEQDEEDDEQNTNEYSTIAPIQSVKFIIRNKTPNNYKPNITMKFNGNDVFAGLHELCDLRIINPERIPGFLTGEEGSNSGIFEDDIFTKISHNDNNNNNSVENNLNNKIDISSV